MKPHLKTYQIGKVSKLVILLAPYVLETGSHTNMEDIFLLKIIPMSTRLQIRDSRTLQPGASCDRQGVWLVDHALHRTIGSLASWRNLRWHARELSLLFTRATLLSSVLNNPCCALYFIVVAPPLLSRGFKGDQIKNEDRVIVQCQDQNCWIVAFSQIFALTTVTSGL